MDVSLKSTRIQSLTSTSLSQIDSLSFSNSPEIHSYPNEENVRLLIDCKSGAKFYKQLVHFHKKMPNQDFYYPEYWQCDDKKTFDVLYCGQNNQIPRVFIFKKSQEDVLGQGVQGIVYFAQELFRNKNHINNIMVAIKVFKVNTSQRKEDFDNEIKMLSLQNRFRGSFYDSKHLLGYLVQDFCYGKSFFDWCYKKIGYDQKKQHAIYERIPAPYLLKKRFVTAILQAYHDLHQQYGILHRDIKPENLMIHINKQDEIIVKIIDFATSCLMQHAEKHFSGTPGYLPPETLNDAQDKPFVSMQTEYWSIGVVCGAWLSEKNYLNYLNKKMAFAQTHSGFIPDFQQKELYKALPDVFNKNEPNLPLLRRNQNSSSSSSSRPTSTLSWEDYLAQSICWLARENVNLRPSYQDITRMLQNLSLYEKNDMLPNTNIDAILIEKMNAMVISHKNTKEEKSIIGIESGSSEELDSGNEKKGILRNHLKIKK